MDVDESGVGAGDMIMDTETPPTEDTDTPPVPPSKRQRTTPQPSALSAICSPRRYKRLNPLLDGKGYGDVSLLMSRSAEQVYYDALDNNVLSCWAIGTSKSVFGEHAYDLAVSSTKSMTGHLLGAAGAIEAIFTILALKDQILPPTINLENPSEGCDLDYVTDGARKATLEYALSNSFGFGGTNGSLLFKKYNA